VSDEQHTYIEQSDEAICDFCCLGEATYRWYHRRGGAKQLALLRKADGASNDYTFDDADGWWGTCEKCDADLRTFHASNLPLKVRLRSFSRKIVDRCPQPELRETSEQRKTTTRVLMESYAAVLPYLENRTPYTAISDPPPAFGRFYAKGDKDVIDQVRQSRDEMRQAREDHGEL